MISAKLKIMLFLVVEKFKDCDHKPIYDRLAEKGRMMPEGLEYVNSWISDDFSTCWQVMEADDPTKFDQWIASWDDLMDFTVVPVMTSAEARAKSSAG